MHQSQSLFRNPGLISNHHFHSTNAKNQQDTLLYEAREELESIAERMEAASQRR